MEETRTAGEARVLHAFLRQFLADQTAGRARSLANYQALFPGHDRLIAEHLARYRDRSDHGSEDEGARIFGPYVLLQELGRGGQAAVFLAEDPRLGRRVALKMLSGLNSLSKAQAGRFERETRVTSRLEHPGICPVYDVGTEQGVPYLTMPYIDGPSLEHLVETARASGRATALGDDLQRVLEVVEKVARALHLAHEAGVVHRDIKAANVLIGADGEPVIVDFGLARAADEAGQTLTRSGDLLGTPAYMSPEQIAASRIEVDRRSDVYSLGVTLYECVTLHRPFESPTRQGLYRAILAEDPPNPRRLNPRVTADLRAVIDKALAKHPDRRYATTLALAEDLRAVQEGRATVARPLSPAARAWRYARRRPARAALAAVLVFGLPALAGLAGFAVAVQDDVAAVERERLGARVDEHLEDGLMVLWNGDDEVAARSFASAVALSPDSIEAIGGLALARLARGDARGAIEQLDAASPRLAGSIALRHLRALAEGGDEVAELTDAELEGASAADHFLVGCTMLLERRPADLPGEVDGRRIAELFDRTTFLAIGPPRRLYLLARARAWFEDPRLDRSTEEMRKTLELLRSMWPDSCWVEYVDGIGSNRLGDPFGALQALARCRESMPESRAAMRLRGRAWAELAGQLFGAEHLGRAASACERAIASFDEAEALDDDTCAHAMLQLSRLRQLDDRLEDTAHLAERVIALKPDDATGHWNRHFALRYLGRYAEALPPLREAERLGYQNAAAAMPGFVKLVEALPDLEKLIAGEGTSEQWVENARAGDLALLRDQPERAECLLRAALQAQPEHRLLRARHAVALHELGRYAEAQTAFIELFEEQPGNGYYAVLAARAAARLGDVDAAFASWQRAIEAGQDRVTLNLATWHRDADLLLLQHDPRFAESFGAVVEARRTDFGADDARTRDARAHLVAVLLEQQRFDEAETRARALYATEQRLDSGWRRAEAARLLGDALAGAGRATEAQPYLRECAPWARLLDEEATRSIRTATNH